MTSQRNEVERLMAKYKNDIEALEEQEEDILRRIKILENIIPTVLVWYMWKVSQADRPAPSTSTHTEGDAQMKKLVHLETILSELQEADRVLKEEENIMLRKIEILEESLKDTESIHLMLSEPSTSRLRPEKDKIAGEIVDRGKKVKPAEGRPIIFEDLMKDADTDWKQTCEELCTEVRGLREYLQETSEKLKESENYVKKLEEDNKLKDGAIQQKILDIEMETKAVFAEVIEQEQKRIAEEEREDKKVIMAVEEAMEEMMAIKVSLQIKSEITIEESKEETEPVELVKPLVPYDEEKKEEEKLKIEEAPEMLKEAIEEKIPSLVLTPEEVMLPGSAEILPKPAIPPPQIFERLEMEAETVTELSPETEVLQEAPVSETLPGEPEALVETEAPSEPAVETEAQPTEIEASAAESEVTPSTPENLPTEPAMQMEAEAPPAQIEGSSTKLEAPTDDLAAEPEVEPPAIETLISEPGVQMETEIVTETLVTETETSPDELASKSETPNPVTDSELIIPGPADLTEAESPSTEMEALEQVSESPQIDLHANGSETVSGSKALPSDIEVPATVSEVSTTEALQSSKEPTDDRSISTPSPAREAAETVEALAITSEPLEVQSPAEAMLSTTSTGFAAQQGPSGTRGPPSADSLASQTLQGKCRVKDHLIKSMADQLREQAKRNVWSGSQMLAKTSEDPVKTYDFDRTTLLQYLKGQEPKDMGPSLKSNEGYSTTNPLDVKVVRKLDHNSLMIAWGPPPSQETVGFQIFVNGEFKYWVHSAKRNIALLHPLDLKSEIEITVCPVGENGKVLHRSSVKYVPGVN